MKQIAKLLKKKKHFFFYFILLSKNPSIHIPLVTIHHNEKTL